MKHKSGILPIIVIGLLASALPAAGSVVAFVGVNVVPMDRERVLSNQTVVVENGRITAVGPADRTNVPAGAVRVEGRGKYLTPGLSEMHGHIPDANSPQQSVEDVLFMFVANGVTTVRGVLGSPGQLALRDKANKGEIIAPNLYLAGPGFSGNPAYGIVVESTDQAIRMVREQKSQGWDLLKVLPGLSLPAYDAMARTAKEVGMRFAGHVPAEVGLLHAIEMGQETFEHMDGFVEYLNRTAGPVDDAKLLDLVWRMSEAGAWVVPTMAYREIAQSGLDLKTVTSYPELKYMPPNVVQQWSSSLQARLSSPQFKPAVAKQVIDNRMRILKALHDGGVGILLGTDAPQQFSVPGFSIHREMKRMVDAGMSPFEVIRSGTQNVGVYFRDKDKFGTIEVGKRADLILVDADPLQDIANVARLSGVMVRGSWLPKNEIKTRLDKIAGSYD